MTFKQPQHNHACPWMTRYLAGHTYMILHFPNAFYQFHYKTLFILTTKYILVSQLCCQKVLQQ